MTEDVLAGIIHKELTPADKTKFQSVMATATLTVEAVARRAGMEWERRDTYRKLILGQRGNEPTAHEVAVCRGVSNHERAAVQQVETIKFRLLEGFVRLLMKAVSKKVGMAKCFTKENRYHVRRDLNGEALTAFCHAVYHFNRYDIQFSTFLTTVVDNWLSDYCERLATIKLTEQLKEDLAVYHLIRNTEKKADRDTGFDHVVRIIVLNELRDQAVAATERNVEEYAERNYERFLKLRQATNRIVQINGTPIAGSGDATFEALLRDVTDGMSDVQRDVIEFKVLGGGLQEFADERGITKRDAARAFQTAKEMIGAALSVA